MAPTWPTLADALDAARATAALAGGEDVVVQDHAGREIWREYVDAQGRVHPVAVASEGRALDAPPS